MDSDAYDEISHKMKSMMFKVTEHLHWREQGGLGHVRRDFAQDEEHDVQG